MAATQASAVLVTRPHCSLHQHLLQGAAAAAAQLGRHVGRMQPELACPRGVLGRHRRGQLAAGRLGLFLERDQLVGEAASTLLDRQVLFRQAVHRVRMPLPR